MASPPGSFQPLHQERQHGSVLKKIPVSRPRRERPDEGRVPSPGTPPPVLAGSARVEIDPWPRRSDPPRWSWNDRVRRPTIGRDGQSDAVLKPGIEGSSASPRRGPSFLRLDGRRRSAIEAWLGRPPNTVEALVFSALWPLGTFVRRGPNRAETPGPEWPVPDRANESLGTFGRIDYWRTAASAECPACAGSRARGAAFCVRCGRPVASRSMPAADPGTRPFLPLPLPGSAPPPVRSETPVEGDLIGDDQGAVLGPLVRDLAAGSRVADPIAVAEGNGPRVEAKRTGRGRNPLARVHNGDRDLAPSRDEGARTSGGGSGAGSTGAGAGSTGGGGAGRSRAPGRGRSGAGRLVDLNHAMASELDARPGVGSEPTPAVGPTARPRARLRGANLTESRLSAASSRNASGADPAPAGSGSGSASSVAQGLAADGSGTGPRVSSDGSATVPGGAADGEGLGAAGHLVDLNRAALSELVELPGIGPTFAGRIIAAREEQRFATVEALRDRNVIGAAGFAKVRDLLTVSRAGRRSTPHSSKKGLGSTSPPATIDPPPT